MEKLEHHVLRIHMALMVAQHQLAPASHVPLDHIAASVGHHAAHVLRALIVSADPIQYYVPWVRITHSLAKDRWTLVYNAWLDHTVWAGQLDAQHVMQDIIALEELT